MAEELNRHLSKEHIQMANRYMKRCSTSLIIREMHMKTTRYHLISISMAIIKKTKDKHLWGCREKGIPRHCWWECKLVQSLWKTAWRSLKKLKLELPCDPAIPLLGCIFKGNKITNSKRYLHSYVHCSIIQNSQDTETT